MHFARRIVFAALIGSTASPLLAADYPEPIVEVQEEEVVAYGGWYIRGHLGMSNQRFDRLDIDLLHEPAVLDYGYHDEGGFSSAPLFGGGVGYRFNDYLRGDLTIEYRGKSDFDALGWVTDEGGTSTNDYRAKKSEWLVLANAYLEGGDFHGITPYIGAGIGASRNTISHFRDINILRGAGSHADEDPEWNLAWALHAGLGIKATERMTIDLGYSFVSLGDARTKPFYNDDPAWDVENDGFIFEDIYSHDLKLGVRYSLN